MKLFTIEVCACGTVTFHDVDCPSYWRGSGVYDVDYEVHREFRFYVSAFSLDRALKLISRWWFNNEPDWCSLDCVYYDPDTVKEEDDPDEGTTEEVYETDYDYSDPVYDKNEPIPDGYSEELPVLTLQEKLYDLLDRLERNAKVYAEYYKGKDERKSGFYDGQRVLINNIRYQLRK